MLHRDRVKLPKYVYPPEEWRIVEKKFYPRLLEGSESIFSIGNGYLGLRGNFEEGAPVFQHGTFINGFYESWPIVYGELAFGFAKHGQTIVNAMDAKTLKLYVDDEPFFLPTANLIRFERVLDMRQGFLDRDILWETPAGKQVSIRSQRITSFVNRHLAAISYEVTVLNADAPVVISSEMFLARTIQPLPEDPRLARAFKEQILMPRLHVSRDRRILIGHQTKTSRMSCVCGVDHVIELESPWSSQTSASEYAGKVVFSINAKAGQPIRLVKFITYHTSHTSAAEELADRAQWSLDRALGRGFAAMQAGQKQYLDDFWQRSDLQVDMLHKEPERNLEVQQAIRFSLFHILQAAGRAEGAGVPAKGLTGHAYEGHYFWDMEIYVLPFLIYTSPQIAKNILMFRYSMLPKARQRAREVNQKGALFPWRTINGEEASAYYAAGTAQYHINADIIYALMKYVHATGDTDLLYNQGAEMLVETARLWNDLGFYSGRRQGRFCIQGVTGPDEYNTVVDNNTYTNLMARENLLYAVETVETLYERHPERFDQLVDRTQLSMQEVAEWKKAARQMYIPYDEEMGIHPQDDSFLDKEEWDFANTPSDKYPLLLHHHPLVIYRHRVIKQADMVLAMFLLSHVFSEADKRRNFDFYDPLTTGDSSLSVGIQSILAAELGYLDKALRYARYSVLMDLGDVGDNVRDGVHIASMGAVWMVFVCGFAGMRDYRGALTFDPHLSKRIASIRFQLTVFGRVLAVEMNQAAATYTLRQGEELKLRHQGDEICLTAEAPVVTVPIK
ncbi:MAG: glycoside hydrolase family 65 protein [Desulfobacteraceae bacterium]|nr:MAG: glycoside hydrolase family 65 protein [Desulfobacteraceae bacterium]